jgi:hypothetical protein
LVQHLIKSHKFLLIIFAKIMPTSYNNLEQQFLLYYGAPAWWVESPSKSQI